MLGDNPDKSWEYLGAKDPYYAVISTDEYHCQNLDQQKLNRFFESGVQHVDRVLQTIRTHLAPTFQPKRALDFGCGVGRLVIPLTQYCDSVVGIDVSEAMLEEARNNCRVRQIKNVEFFRSDDHLAQISGTFDLVHAYIVFQHIPRARGEWITRHLIELLNDGGIGVLHYTYFRKASMLRRLSLGARKSIPFVNNLRNLLKGDPFNFPVMQLNEYDLNRLLRLLQELGCHHCYIQFSDHQASDTSAYGVMIFFQKRQRSMW